MTSARILVVDDERGVVRFCVRILQRQGYIVSGLSNSQAALELLKQESFDLLLTDIKMPRLDGLELLYLAKQIDPHLNVVLITGYGTMEDAVKAIRLGAQGFIMKPFEPDDLVATIQDNLARRSLVRDSLRLQTLLPLLEINQILQISGGEASLIRRVLEVARQETGASRLAWLICASAALPPVEESAFLSLGLHEMAVAGQTEAKNSLLSPQAFQATLAQAKPIWVLVDGTITEINEGQATIVGALLPLVIRGNVVGLLTAEAGPAGRTGPFNQISLELLLLVAGQLATILENVALFQQAETLRVFNEDIIHNMTNGLIAVDSQARITAFNPAVAAMLGYEEDKVIHQSLLTITHPPEDLFRILEETAQTGKASARQEILVRRAEGVELPVAVSVAPLGWSPATEQFSGAVAVLEDLREIKAFEAERRRLDRLVALGEMSAVVAHEIRNPVAGIAAGIDYLTRNIPPESSEFEGVKMIRGEIQRVNRILEDILFIARPSRLRLSQEDLAQLLENVLQRCYKQIEQNRVKIVSHYAANLPKLLVDRQRLEQVFTNLVINATQAMPKGGELTLQAQLASAPGEYLAPAVVITIADTGPGIPPEARRHIFEPFFTTKTKGTGLGLTVARRILEEHGGSINIDETISRGTCFIIKLPLSEGAAP
ncbi:MAG: response regulator [Anaerolineae bacterium]